jgi:hypothetical protein
MALGYHAASLFYETGRASSSAELEMTAGVDQIIL